VICIDDLLMSNGALCSVAVSLLQPLKDPAVAGRAHTEPIDTSQALVLC
jgi:hypothetical protein